MSHALSKTVAGVCLLALFFSSLSRPIAAQQPDQGDLQLLTLLFLVRDSDAKCGYLEPEEHARVKDLLQYGLARIKDPTRREEIVRRLSKPEEVDCASGNHKGFIDMFRVLLAGKSDSDDDDEVSTEDIKKTLEKNIGALPKGRLKPILGCWQGTFNTWNTRVCFTKGGDELSVRLTAPREVAICEFGSGEARRREGKAFFYAFSGKPTCSDGRPVAHLEGICSNYDKQGMQCLMGVYTRGNVFLSVDATNEEVLNGEFELSRIRQ